MAFALTVISCTARYPKSITFSGWPSAKLASPALPSCPVSVVSGRVSAARLSQVAAPADGARKTHAATAIAKNASHVSKVALHGVVDRTALIATPPIRQSLPDPPTSGNESVSGQPVTRAQSPRCQEWSHRVKGAPPALPSIVPPY